MFQNNDIKNTLVYLTNYRYEGTSRLYLRRDTKDNLVVGTKVRGVLVVFQNPYSEGPVIEGGVGSCIGKRL